METQELYRGRLIDHIQLVVADLDASRRFYQAVFQVLGIPIGGWRRIISGPTSCLSRQPTAKRPRVN